MAETSATDAMERVTQWVDPEEWFGITDPWTGAMWSVLTRDWREAKRIAEEIGGGQIVVIQARIGADADGEYIAPELPDKGY